MSILFRHPISVNSTPARPVPVIGLRRQNSQPFRSLAMAEMKRYMKQAVAHINRLEMETHAKKSVNVELLQTILMAFTLAQQVVDKAANSEKAALGYQFSRPMLDEINRLNKLVQQVNSQDRLIMKSFVQAASDILQGVIFEAYIKA